MVQPNFEIVESRKIETVDLLYGKPATIIGNIQLNEFSYNSIFPINNGSYCEVSNLKKPIYYVRQIEKIKNGTNQVRIRIPDYKINKMYSIESFTWKEEGRLGDISYSISFKEYNRPATVTLTERTSTDTDNITEESLQTDTTATTFNNTLQGDARDIKESKTTTYIVKSGDCLSSIARKYNMKWKDLYDLNKDIIGNDPNLIYVGQELRLIQASENYDAHILAWQKYKSNK